MPAIRQNTSAVTTVQPPHSSSAARTRSVRGARRVSHSPATSRISAAGSSQEIWPPISALNSRVSPAWPPNPPMPAAAGTAALRYAGRQLGAAGHRTATSAPRATATVARAAEDPAQAVVAEGQLQQAVVLSSRRCTGRESAGHSATASSHQPADTTIATPAASSCRIRRQSVVGAAHR